MWINLIVFLGDDIEDTIMGRQDGYLADRVAQTWGALLNLAPGHEPMLEILFSVVRRQNNWKTPEPQRVPGLGSPRNLNRSHYRDQRKQAGDIIGRD